MAYELYKLLLSLTQSQIAYEGVTTSAGAVGGTSTIDSVLVGYGASTFVGMSLVVYCDDATKIDAKTISAFNNGTGEVTVSTAFKSGQIPSGVRYKVIFGSGGGGGSGLPTFAPVTEATSTTQFKSSSLTGYSNTSLVGWWIQCVWDAGGAGAAPQGEWRQVTAYVSLTGLFTHDAFSVQLALTDLVKIVPPEVFAMPTRSSQSGSLLMTGIEQTLYEQVAPTPYLFNGGSIDKSTLLAGDTIVVKIYKKLKTGGSYRQISDNTINTYTGVQTVLATEIIGDTVNQYNYKITIQQSAGVMRTIDHEWFETKRS